MGGIMPPMDERSDWGQKIMDKGESAGEQPECMTTDMNTTVKISAGRS
jgi:hypothetical protein